MDIALENTWARVANATDADVRWLDGILCYESWSNNGIQTYRLYDNFNKRFPAGLVAHVMKRAVQDKFEGITLTDTRVAPCAPDMTANLSWLRDYQLEAVDTLVKRTRGIIHAPTGSGKCLGLGTPVLLFDGRIKPVEDIVVGDRLMGPDSQPRTVQSVTTGFGPLYRVVPKRGAPWMCNAEHVLSLIDTVTGVTTDISLADYALQNKTWRHRHKLFSTGVVFPPRIDPLPVSPYFLGIWLGDGGKDIVRNGIRITKPDPEIRQAVEAETARFNLVVKTELSGGGCPRMRPVREAGNPVIANPLKAAVLACIGSDFTVSDRYLCGSTQERQELLAGLLDTSGHYDNKGYDFVQKRKPIADATAFLARSLGLRATMRAKQVPGYGEYWRITISGDCSELPLRLPRKKAHPTRRKGGTRRTGFRIESAGYGQYVGFRLDSDGRFLLGDFTVTHNSEVAVGLTQRLPCRWLMLAHREMLTENIADRYNERTGAKAGRIAGGAWEIGDGALVCATFQALAAGIKKGNQSTLDLILGAQGIIVDECHVAPADSYRRIIGMARNAYWRVGLSGTPLSRTDHRSMFAIGSIGRIIYRVRTERLIADGLISKPTIVMRACEQSSDQQEWSQVHRELIVNSKVRNQIVVDMVKEAPKSCIVFVTSLRHGRALAKSIQAAGIKSEFVDGKSSLDTRKQAVKRLDNGSVEALVATTIFNEGIDIPDLRAVVIAAGGASAIQTLQRIGRGMRRTADKDEFHVYDIADKGHPWTERHAQARARAYRSEGHEITKQP